MLIWLCLVPDSVDDISVYIIKLLGKMEKCIPNGSNVVLLRQCVHVQFNPNPDCQLSAYA